MLTLAPLALLCLIPADPAVELAEEPTYVVGKVGDAAALSDLATRHWEEEEASKV